MNTIARPAGDQPLGIGNRWLCVLDDVAVDVLPLAVTELRVALSAELDAVNAITPEDVGTECRQTHLALVVRGRGDLIRLEEVNTRRRQFDHLGQVSAQEVFHLGKAHRSVLEDVDRCVVRGIGQNVAERKRYLCLG